MKRTRWTCDVCNPRGARKDGRGLIDGDLLDNYQSIMEDYGWGYVDESCAQHVCAQCVEEKKVKDVRRDS